ncbi:MAG: ATP-binding cassette domain-containing protein, partial [Planctomycetota bacterium]|nr:ATP-binding cassette domain-containing protein [Planctomycetota bacterium]
MIQTDTPNVIETVGLTKIFKDFWLRDKVVAVADLNLSVAPGEVFGLLGPNGSGKSTTLKMLLGLLFPTRGRVAVLGHRPTDVRVKARIGFLPEESYLYPFLNAVETLDYYGQLFHQGRRQRRRRVGMLLDMVGLDR